jgi:hypothetical protein
MMSKRLVLYTNELDRVALWLYGPMNSDNIWKVLTSKDVDFEMMSQSHHLINNDDPHTEELVEATKVLVSMHGKEQVGS